MDLLEDAVGWLEGLLTGLLARLRLVALRLQPPSLSSRKAALKALGTRLSRVARKPDAAELARALAEGLSTYCSSRRALTLEEISGLLDNTKAPRHEKGVLKACLASASELLYAPGRRNSRAVRSVALKARGTARVLLRRGL